MVVSAIKTPGVYVNEVSIFPPSVAQVPTAIPAFIGYTEKAEETNGESLFMKYKKISSMVEFLQYFGGAPKLVFDKTTGNGVELDGNNQVVKAVNKQQYFLYDSMQMFFANGGGDCYIIAVEKYKEDGSVSLGTAAPLTGMTGGLEVLKEIDEPTMIVFPDAVSMGTLDMYSLQQTALQQAADLMDRVGVFDIKKAEDKTTHDAKVKEFRDNIGMANLKYGAVYTPWLKVGIKKEVRYRDIKDQIVQAGTTTAIVLSSLVKNLSVADTTTIKNQITLLNEVVSDNKFIAKRIGLVLDSDIVANPEFPEYTPTGTVKDLPSLTQGFDILLQSVNSLIATAEANPTVGNVNAAATEIVKVVRQIYNLAVLLDDFGFKDALFMSNQKMLENTWTAIGYTSPYPVFPVAALGDFLAKLTDLAKWDSTISSLNVANAISSAPAAVAQGGLGVGDLVFQTYTLPAANLAAVTPALMPIAAPASATDRITNQKAAVPKLQVLFNYFYNIVAGIELFGAALEKAAEEELKRIWPIFKGIIDGVNNNLTILPPSGAMAGIYSRVDNERGVWKAPANVSVTYAKGLLVNITDKLQENLNIDVDAGKSVNAIRAFSGKGVMVWGARTLAGNDNEWRYVPVRRFFNMVEESVKKSTFWAVFEPNDANTWVKVKSMIENYLTLLWRQGALAGAKPEEAFFVEVGLNKTMTFVDILEGRMIVKIGMAAVRPAEFIILEFSHKVQTS